MEETYTLFIIARSNNKVYINLGKYHLAINRLTVIFDTRASSSFLHIYVIPRKSAKLLSALHTILRIARIAANAFRSWEIFTSGLARIQTHIRQI